MATLDELVAAYEEERATKAARGESMRELPAIDSPQNKLIAIMRENLGIKADKPNEAVIKLPENQGQRQTVNISFGPTGMTLTPNEYKDLPVTISITPVDGGLRLNPSQSAPKWYVDNQDFSPAEKRDAMAQLNAAAQAALLGVDAVAWSFAKENGGLTREKIDRMLDARSASSLPTSVTEAGLEAQLKKQFFADIDSRLTLEKSPVAGMIMASRAQDAEGNLTAARIIKERRERESGIGQKLIDDLVSRDTRRREVDAAVAAGEMSLLDAIVEEGDNRQMHGRNEISPRAGDKPAKRVDMEVVAIIPREANAGVNISDLLAGAGVTGGVDVKDHRDPAAGADTRTPEDILRSTTEAGRFDVASTSKVDPGAPKPGVKTSSGHTGRGS